MWYWVDDLVSCFFLIVIVEDNRWSITLLKNFVSINMYHVRTHWACTYQSKCLWHSSTSISGIDTTSLSFVSTAQRNNVHFNESKGDCVSNRILTALILSKQCWRCYCRGKLKKMPTVVQKVNLQFIYRISFFDYVNGID